MGKQKPSLLIFSTSIIVLFAITITYINLPSIQLKALWGKKPIEYNINYIATFKPSSFGQTETNGIQSYLAEDKHKVIKTYQNYPKNGVQQTDSTPLPPRIYFEDSRASYECFTPVFINAGGGVVPQGNIECGESTIIKDPLSNDSDIDPDTRLDLIINKIKRKDLSYTGVENVINRKCKMFIANLVNLKSEDSESLKYLRDVYRVEPDTAKISFCLDSKTGIPLKAKIETVYNGNQGTEIDFVATQLELSVNSDEFDLPTTTNQPSPLETNSESIDKANY